MNAHFHYGLLMLLLFHQYHHLLRIHLALESVLYIVFVGLLQSIDLLSVLLSLTNFIEIVSPMLVCLIELTMQVLQSLLRTLLHLVLVSFKTLIDRISLFFHLFFKTLLIPDSLLQFLQVLDLVNLWLVGLEFLLLSLADKGTFSFFLQFLVQFLYWFSFLVYLRQIVTRGLHHFVL